jgi:20S proteasome subunit alpha 6
MLYITIAFACAVLSAAAPFGYRVFRGIPFASCFAIRSHPLPSSFTSPSKAVSSHYCLQYDTDVTVWSPQGRLHQVEYAMEAVKQGSACVGLRSNDFAVLVALKRSSSELSSYQQKIFQVDDHCGVVGSGLAADSSVLCKFMRKECMSFRYVYNGDIPVNRLVLKVADKCQECTQNAGSRPFGVGFLVAGYDQAGPHIFQSCPSGNYFEYKAYTIGARSQVYGTMLQLLTLRT